MLAHAWHSRLAEKKGHEGGRTTRGRLSSASVRAGFTALGGRATRRSLWLSLASMHMQCHDSGHFP